MTLCGTGSRRRRCAGSSQRDRRPIPGPSARRRWTTAPSRSAPVQLTANAVTLSANSEARAARGRTLLEPVLTGLVCAPLIERQTVEQMMASPRDRSSAQDAPHLPPTKERRIIHQGLTDHYRRTLDAPIPSLGDQSPRRGGEDRERSGEGDRLVEDAGEPFRTAGEGRSGRQLRLHLDLEGTWPRRRAAMNRSSDLHRAFKAAV